MAVSSRAWGAYTQVLHRRPVPTKVATSVVAAVMGDLLAQRMARPAIKPDNWRYDWKRTFRFVFFNAAFMAPLGHHYYAALDAIVMPHSSKSLAAVVSKVAIDQLVFAPVCTCIFYLWKAVSEKRFGDYSIELREKLGPTMLANWKLWPAAHLANFALVPNEHRILYINVVSVLGTYLLSRIAHSTGAVSRKTEKQQLQCRPTQEVIFDGVIEKFE